MIILTPRATIQSYAVARALGWKPTQIYTNQVSATDAYLTTARNAGAGDLVEGTISIQYAKDPSNPIWANDPAVKLYRTIMSKYYPNGEARPHGERKQPTTASRWRTRSCRCSASPARPRLAPASSRRLRSWNKVNPFLLPNNPQRTTAKNQFPIRGFRLVQYGGRTFKFISPMLYPRGRELS